MTASRETSPGQLFLRMMCGIALTSSGPILLVLVLIVHIRIGAHGIADSAIDVARARMIALCAIVTGIPIWFFTQLRLARGIRDGEWRDEELAFLRRILFGQPVRLVGIFTLLTYAIGVYMRGSFYWLVGFGVLVFPLGAFGDLYKQFIVRYLTSEAEDTDRSPAPVIPITAAR